jgi:hypothetical protein
MDKEGNQGMLDHPRMLFLSCSNGLGCRFAEGCGTCSFEASKKGLSRVVSCFAAATSTKHPLQALNEQVILHDEF